MTYEEWLAHYLNLGIRESRARFMALTSYWYQERDEARRFEREIRETFERRFLTTA